MQQQNISFQNESKAGKKRRWTPVLLLLLVLALITSSILGYVLGRNAGTPPLGQIIDTVVLEPEDPSGLTVLHLAGRVVYSDKSPAAGRTLELRSDPVTTVSDSGGGFLFENVPRGEHTLSILNEDGTTAATRKINLVRDEDIQGAAVRLQETGVYVVELSVDIRVLEIEIQLDGDALTIGPALSYAAKDGTVTTPAGSASITDGVIVTPQGNVFLPDGSVVFPGTNKTDTTHIVLPDDTVIINKPLTQDEIQISADGTVSLPDGTVIEPGGTIHKPDGKTETPGDTGVIVGDGVVTPIGREPEQKPSGSDSSSAPQPPNSSAGSSNPPVSSQPSGSGGSSSKPSGSQSQAPDPSKPDTPDDGKLNAYGQSAGGAYTAWTQNRAIDLFYNRTSGGREKIAPGSSGYYLFRLQNTRSTGLRIRITLNEGNGLHLPLSFTLTPLDKNGNKLAGKSVSGSIAGGDITLNTAIDAGDTTTYQLDWAWPFDGQDADDTRVGSGTELSYLLSMTIRAEEGA